MPHVLFNHITHTWDEPEDAWTEAAREQEEPIEVGERTRYAVAHLALAAATAVAALVILGLVAGLLFGPAF